MSLSELLNEGIEGKRVLVPGCGAGFDAVVTAKLGARVSAFDISPEMLAVAAESARDARVEIELLPMAFEALSYPDDSFDVVYIRDVLHHCDIKRSVCELVRVAKPGAWIVIDELYTHSWLQRVRTSWIGRSIYPAVRPVIYAHGEEYITEDERKLDERDLGRILGALSDVRCQFFNFFVNRFLPDWDGIEIVDRTLMHGLPGRLVAGRFVLSGWARK